MARAISSSALADVTKNFSRLAAPLLRTGFSPEFKAKVGLEAIRGLKTVNELGQEYGVHPVQISQWKKAILEQSEKLFEGKQGPKPVSEHQEPDRLYGEDRAVKDGIGLAQKRSGISLP